MNLQKEAELLALFYQNEQLKISDISNKLGISKSITKKLIDKLIKSYSINIVYDKKTKSYYLLQKVIEKEVLKVSFWEELLLFIFYSFIKSDNSKLKQLFLLLMYNFYNFVNVSKSNGNKIFFDSDLLFVSDDSFLFYVKEMDYTLFIKLKHAIVNKNEVRVSFYDRISLIVKRVNVYPLYLSFLRKDWFLISYSPDDQNYLVINVEDIKDVSLTGKFFDDNFSGFVEDAFPELREYIVPSKKYTVLLDFSDYVKVYNICFLHPSQKIIKDNDKVFLQLEIANLSIFFRWLSSYGKLVKILEPEIIKQKYIDYLLSIVDFYNT